MMDTLYTPYQYLGADTLKLLCLLAYTGRSSDTRLRHQYARSEGANVEMVTKTLNTLRRFYKVDYYSYRGEYQLHPHHVAPLMLYLMEQQPEWLRQFDRHYKSLQRPNIMQLRTDMSACLGGRPIPLRRSPVIGENADILVPLASDERFLPMMSSLQNIDSFLAETLTYQAVNDIADPRNVVGKIAQMHLPRMKTADKHTLLDLVALYDFFKQGRYDSETLSRKGKYSCILASGKALMAGDYDKAYNLISTALREYNRQVTSREKGFFGMALDNYLLVMAYYFSRADDGKKLTSLLGKDLFDSRSDYQPLAWLTRYLSTGQLPSERTVRSYIHEGSITTDRPLYKYLGLLAARFFHYDIPCPPHLPPIPNMRLLRHELSPWTDIPESERQQLDNDFGGSPLLSRIRYKEPWELLLEELTPHSGKEEQEMERTSRVAYIINYSSMEIREQKRLKSGAWGAGKRMSIDTFRQGTDFMDETDHRIAASTRGSYYYDLKLADALPHLVGTDRLYTGWRAPLTPVTVDEEKPYLIIERVKNGFTVKSNLRDADLTEPVVYRKDSETHYTVIRMTDQQRVYYQKLLRIGTFPSEAEEQLREFLPKVSDVVEVHSDLVEGGSTLEQRPGSAQLCLQAMPQSGAAGSYSVWCMARPLTAGKTLLEPGQGLNPCVAEEDGRRYQVTRDMKGERANLQLLRTFVDDNSLSDADEAFTDRAPLTLDAIGLLRLMDFVRQQPEQFFMEWPEGGQLHLKVPHPADWNISLRSKAGWFEVEGEIPIDEDTVLTTAQLLQLVAESPQSGFIRLSDTDFLAISDRLRKQLARIESLAVNNRGHVQISEFHASLLGSALNGEIDIKHDKTIDQLQRKIKKSMAQRPAVPVQLKAELRDYQTDGFQWMVRMTGWGAGVCLADDMGLGKTVQTIAFMLHTAQEGPALVAAPASVVLNWRRELERFAPTLRVTVLNSMADRHTAIDEAGTDDVVITTYGLFVTECDSLLDKKWNTVCLDEAHVIKNRQTKTSASVMRLQAKHRIILTGTPVQNHLGELWNLYQFINPGLLGSHDHFHDKYIVPIELQDNKERSRQLKRIVSPFMLRRTKQEVIEELPDKTEINMPVELSDDEMAVYEVIRRRAKQMLEDEQSAAGVSVNTLAEITRLRQAACSAQLAEKGWTGECSKINVLSDLLQEIVGGGNSVLVFSQFTSFLALVRQQLDQLKLPYLYLDGSVAVRQRDQLVQQFQRGLCPVFLISLKAGGLGLNLTGANYVIHLDPWWNPAVEQQATDRAYRIGQRQNVTVYHLISQHTIEEKILRLHQSKRNLADAMLSGTNESHKLTSRELLQMIGGEKGNHSVIFGKGQKLL